MCVKRQMPAGSSKRTSRFSPHARAAGPTSPSSSAASRVTAPASSNRARTRRRVPEQVHGVADVGERFLQALAQLGGAGGFEVERHAARRQPRPAEAVAAGERGQVQHVAAQPAAVGSGGQIADVAGERAEVAGVVRDPLEFERDPAEHLGARRAASRRPATRRPGSKPWRGRSSCRRRASPCSAASAGPARRRARARRRDAGSRAKSPGGTRPRRGTGSGNAPAR